ncbi:hypothetical protein C5167_004328 [Papaver somniferum]|uniref:DUF4378 domain-containing protein n=1 Tax=Papaver somniferum TaxID=3469 RepID=A0A4Y7J972_PAPSO|nr:uncharacterized protein LOC113274538 [Papaver somniferum]XP_026379694.1 uncharacterized protein LOC113274538 [Papaver somniferum]RZC57026.1 hypothetical protein C5167_004328 [Papaver somniferum]
MGKRVQKNSVYRDKTQAGCISGLISIFDFRYGRSSQKLLPDRRHGSNRLSIGNGYSKKKLKLLTDAEGAREGNAVDENRTSKIDICRRSVKKLMEEEMFSQKQPKKKPRTASVDFQEPEYSHLDLVSLMEEFCNHVHQRLNKGDSSDGQESTSSTSNDNLDELDLQLVQKHTILQEKLSEAAEAFLSQKFIDSGQMTDEAKIQQTKQFMDALDILNSNKELLLKLLEDSNSLLVKHIEDLRGSQPEKSEPKKSVTRTKASEQEIDNSTQCQELVVHKETPKQNMYKFFWRKGKSENKNAPKEIDSPRASNRIVILKPNPAAIINPAAATSLNSPRSSTQFLYSPVGNQEQGDTLHSKFSLKGIKNKLKRVMGENKKEQHRISMDAILHKIPNDNSADYSREFSGELSGRQLQRKSSYRENADNPVNNDPPSNDYEVTLEGDASYKSVTIEDSGYSKEREADIYAEAKRHLSDMLSYREEDRNTSAFKVSKSLGKTLSLPDYVSPPVCSPRDSDHPFITAQMRFSFSDNLRVVGEKVWQPLNPELSTTSSQNFETELHTDDDFQTDDDIQIQALDLNPDTSRECPETVVQESNSALEEDGTAEETVETIEAVHIEESKSSDDPCESNTSVPADVKSSSTETDGTSEEEGSPGSLTEEDRNNEPSMSSVNSSYSPDLKVEALDSSSDGVPAWESPVSVLKPFFLDDASSPATPKTDRAELKIKPVRICFDERDSTVVVVSPSDPELHSAACFEDRKPTYDYVRAVLRASGLSWDEFTSNYESSSHLLDASLIDEVEVPSSRLCGEPELIFDCIDEVLVDLYERYFGCPPWLKFVKSDIRPVPEGNSIIKEVWEFIDTNLIPQPQPCTLDHIVGKDFNKEGSWGNLRLDIEDIGIEISEAILIELIQDAVFDMRSLVELTS